MEGRAQIMCNINENRRSGEELLERERRFRAIFDLTFQFMALLTPGGDVLEVNRAALLFVGAQEKDVIGRKFWMTPWWSHSRKLMNMLRNAVKESADQRLQRFEATHRSSDGALHYFDFSLKPVLGKEGKAVFLIAEGRDITERRNAETLLRESEERYRIAIEKSNDGVALTKGSLHFYVNEKFLKMFGYENIGEIVGQPITITVHPDDQEMVTTYSKGGRKKPITIRVQGYPQRWNGYIY